MARFADLVQLHARTRRQTGRPETQNQKRRQGSGTEESAQRHDIGSGLIEPEAHEESSQSAREAEDSPDPSVNRSIGTQSKVAADQVRNNVRLCAETETDEERPNECSPDGMADGQESKPDRNQSEERGGDTGPEEHVQQITTAYPSDEHTNAKQ